jgi:KDO2-lipid IV(A) lauroyltransferase
LNVSESAPASVAATREHALPRRWTLHGLNNGAIFHATYRGVLRLPRRVSYAIGFVGTWIAWRLMPDTRRAVADNLRAIFPHESQAQLERRALVTLRAYAQDVIDFLRALKAPREEAEAIFEARERDMALFSSLRERQRGLILVTGHYGNWEIGSVFLRRVLDVPLSIVAMAEADESVNRIRREIRDSLGTDTIEVKKSFDTALQIRRRLSENGVVAMLMDRHLGRDRIDVTFLGRRTGFLGAPALMGYVADAPLLPCFIERLGPARFSIQPGTPIHVRRDRPRDEAIRIATQEFADQLEARVRTRPSHWYHFYPYWKAQTGSYGDLID